VTGPYHLLRSLGVHVSLADPEGLRAALLGLTLDHGPEGIPADRWPRRPSPSPVIMQSGTIKQSGDLARPEIRDRPGRA